MNLTHVRPRHEAVPITPVRSRVAERMGWTLLLAPVFLSGVVIPLLPPLAWKVNATVAGALVQAGGFYVLARLGVLRGSPLDRPALAFLGATILATIFSVDRLVSFYPSSLRGEGLLVSAAYITAGLAAARLPRRAGAVLLNAVLAGGSVVGLVALAQFYDRDLLQLAGFHLARPEVDLAGGTRGFIFDPTAVGTRSIATLGQPLVVGGLAALVLPVGVTLTVLATSRAAAILRGAATAMVYGALVASQTRAAWVATAIAGGLLLWLLPRSPLVRRRMILFAATLTVMTVLMVASRPQAALPQRVSSIAEELQHSDRSLGQRLYIWKHTIRLIAQRPVLGWGFSTLLGRFPDYGSAEYRQMFGEEAVQLIDNPHNEFLHVLFSTGLVGLAAYLWIWTVSATRLLRAWRTRSTVSALSAALLASLGAYFIWMQSAWSHIGVANVFWVFLGLAVAFHEDRPTT